MVIKYDLGKLPLPIHPRDFVPTRLDATQTEVLEICQLTPCAYRIFRIIIAILLTG